MLVCSVQLTVCSSRFFRRSSTCNVHLAPSQKDYSTWDKPTLNLRLTIFFLIKGESNYRASIGPGNVILQTSRNIIMVMWKGKITDQEVRPIWQKQSRARAERGSRSCSDQLSRTKNQPLPCRDSPEREPREITGLVWDEDFIEMHVFIHFRWFFLYKLKHNCFKDFFLLRTLQLIDWICLGANSSEMHNKVGR